VRGSPESAAEPTYAEGNIVPSRRKPTVVEIVVWTFAIIEAAAIGLALWYR